MIPEFSDDFDDGEFPHGSIEAKGIRNVLLGAIDRCKYHHHAKQKDIDLSDATKKKKKKKKK
jgi:hypothetical protein